MVPPPLRQYCGLQNGYQKSTERGKQKIITGMPTGMAEAFTVLHPTDFQLLQHHHVRVATPRL